VTEQVISIEAPVVVRSPNWLGDAVMALPAVRNLKALFFDRPLTVAAPEKLVALWQKCPFVDQVIGLREPKSLAVSAQQLADGRFASAVLLPNSLRAAAEAWKAGIPQRYGYARGGRRLLLTKSLPAPVRNPARLHQRYYYLDLVTALGAPSEPSMPKLRKNPTTVGPGLREPIIAVCPGAEYGPAKRWPVDNFLAVARHFASSRKAKIVLLGAPGDIPIAQSLAAQLPSAENRVGETTLNEFMDALASARLVICNDSGAMHLASALGVPTLAIFGSTEPQLTGPLGARSRVLRHHVPCGPCFLRECPLDFACMKQITPEMAIAMAETLLR
jgi:heptosyltransferase-2